MKTLYRLFQIKDNIHDKWHLPTLEEFIYIKSSVLLPRAYSIEITEGAKIGNIEIHSEAFKSWRANVDLVRMKKDSNARVSCFLSEVTSCLMAKWLPNKRILFIAGKGL